MLNKNLGLFSVAFMLIFSACSKNDNTPNTTFKVRMTDAPFDAQEVNVEIKEVRVNYANDSLPWTTLPTNTGVYNLLNLQNGKDTLLSTGSIPAGTIKQLRFILGKNNTIKIDNVVYPLAVASGDESGLKINLNKRLNRNIDSVLVDFDAALLIIKTGNGQFKLKPVLKLK